MEIRRLTATDDAATAGRIVQKAYFVLPDYPHEDEYDRLLGDVAGRAALADVIVGLIDAQVVACLTFVASSLGPHAEFVDPEAASFRYFGVDPGAQGSGVGAAMVQWCIDEARRLGRRRILIHTLTMMHAAQRLYGRLGFERAEALDANWDGVVGLAYRLDL